jgi:phospholipid N-methyltransferase
VLGVSRGGWSYIVKVNLVSVTIEDNWGNDGANFTRTVPFDKLAAVMTRAEVEAARDAGRLVDSFNGVGFFVTSDTPPAVRTADRVTEPADPFERLAESLRSGVRVVTAPQLFPTPPDLARRVVELAGIRPGMTVLEPSAGTGTLVRAIREAVPGATIEAVELNRTLVDRLSRLTTSVRCADFLSLNGELCLFDRIVMNPPFGQAEDIRHVEHALTKLKAGGQLVAIVANGPRQRAKLQPLAMEWIDLPAGSFTEQGTAVNAAIVVIEGCELVSFLNSPQSGSIEFRARPLGILPT